MRRSAHVDALTSSTDAGGGLAHQACRMCGGSGLHYMTMGHRLLARCRRCAFVCAPALDADDGALGAATTDRMLHQAPWQTYAEPAETPLEFLAPVWQFLPDDRPLRILDVGGGPAETAQRLRARGHQVVVVTEGAATSRHADRLWHGLRALRLAPRHFDLAYSYHLFEHLQDPRPVLDALLALARPGAPVLLQTPMQCNGESIATSLRLQRRKACAYYGHRTFACMVADTSHRIAWADSERVIIRPWMGEMTVRNDMLR